MVISKPHAKPVTFLIISNLLKNIDKKIEAGSCWSDLLMLC